MAKRHKPRSGSLAFYPRKRAKRETPLFKSLPKKDSKEVKPLCFYGYKVGMTHVIVTDTHKGSPTYNMNVAKAVTVLETPPIFIFGVRAYEKTPQGLRTLGEFYCESLPKELSRRVVTLKKRKKESVEKESQKEVESLKSKEVIENLVKEGKVYEIRLLACLQPKLTSIGKKKPEIVEIGLSGPVEEQLKYAISKLGKEISVKDIFTENELVDIKAVTKGKGFEGVVKRFGVKMHRPKSKKRRVVGSLGPITPRTIQWTVPRPGQLGYQTRTEYNKRILKIGNEPFAPKSGWKNYGLIKNDYIIVEGSIAGPAKRCVALRPALRAQNEKQIVYEVKHIAAKE
ncbi:MAG: 50S ribosomal protein L3 [Candidatus Diapherotrites archaeon]